jgi:hypothetical protein
MAEPHNLAEMFRVPAHIMALQLLVNRCPDEVSRKHLIVTAGSVEAIGRDEGFMILTANMLETA